MFFLPDSEDPQRPDLSFWWERPGLRFTFSPTASSRDRSF
jgi:hypothetical protein